MDGRDGKVSGRRKKWKSERKKGEIGKSVEEREAIWRVYARPGVFTIPQESESWTDPLSVGTHGPPG